jgi:catenin alpha
MTSDGVQLNGFSAAAANNNMSQAASNLGLNWNPKHLEIKTRSVEKTLEPLVFQVTTLVSSKSPQKKKGKSKRAHVLVAAVERATANFVERGQIIARENPEIEPEMLQAVDEVQHTGEAMSTAAREFATDPCSSVKRGNMVSAVKHLYDLLWSSWPKP